LLRKNKHLENQVSEEGEEYRMLKDELMEERKKTMGLEQYAEKKRREYENTLREEEKKKKRQEQEAEELQERNYDN